MDNTRPAAYPAVVAPSVPDAVRGLLRTSADELSPLPILLGGLLTLWLGVAGGAVLVTGAHPRDVDPFVWSAVAVGSVVAAAGALVATVRTVLRRRAVRAAHARWGDQVVSSADLAAASATPGVGEALDAALAAIADIRASAPYREGWLGGLCDEPGIRAAEWSVAVAARHASRRRTGLASSAGPLLLEQVEGLLALRESVLSLADQLDEQRTGDLVARTLPVHEGDRADTVAAVDELTQLVRRRETRSEG